MNFPQPIQQELLSALADGEIASDEDVFLSGPLYADWDSYQVIGQALRSGRGGPELTGADPAFLSRLNLRLADEKMYLPVIPVSEQTAIILPTQPAANEAVFRWKMLAGFASVTAAVIVGWSFAGLSETPQSVQLSQIPAPEQVLVASPQGPVVRDARLEELMTAHRQFAGSSLQAPSGFLRNAGFENPQIGGR